MNDAKYWVNITRDGDRLGAGFLLTSCFVLTADHCLAGAATEAESVEVILENGEALNGRVLSRDSKADLAVIYIPRSSLGLIIPRPGHAGVGDAWRSPYRPSLSHAHLSGTIEDVSVKYACEGGDLVDAIQLGCLQDLGDYAGYSGSPIEGFGPDEESRLFGILIEQYPQHYPDTGAPRPASKVLFAAMISWVLDRFDCFKVNHLFSILPSSLNDNTARPREENGRSAARFSRDNDIKFNLASARAKIEELAEIQERGLLDEQNITALKIRVLERHMLGDGAGEQQ